MTMLLQAALSSALWLNPRASPPAHRNSGPCALPLALSALRHGDFPRSVAGSELPVCVLRSRASSASLPRARFAAKARRAPMPAYFKCSPCLKKQTT